MYPCIHLPIYPSIHLSVCLSIHPSIHPSTYLSIYTFGLCIFFSVDGPLDVWGYVKVHRHVRGLIEWMGSALTDRTDAFGEDMVGNTPPPRHIHTPCAQVSHCPRRAGRQGGIVVFPCAHSTWTAKWTFGWARAVFQPDLTNNLGLTDKSFEDFSCLPRGCMICQAEGIVFDKGGGNSGRNVLVWQSHLFAVLQ